MNFRAFGPFGLERWSPEDVDGLYKQFEESAQGLTNASGVYLVATKINGTWHPQYVGKTDVKFGGRFKAHFDRTLKRREQSVIDHAALFEQIYYSHQGGLWLFVIAVITPTGSFEESRSERTSELIGSLERSLISVCHSKNERVWNLTGKGLSKFDPSALLNWRLETANASEKQLIEILGL